MENQTYEKIAKLREELAALEAQASKERENTLKSLPAAAGCKTMEELVLLLVPFTKLRVVQQRKQKNSDTAPAGEKKGGKRAKVTEEMKKEMEKLLRGGEMTAKAIADKMGVSMPTVNTLKKSLGLTKARA